MSAEGLWTAGSSMEGAHRPKQLAGQRRGQAASGPAASGRTRTATRVVGCRCAALLCTVLCCASLSKSRYVSQHMYCACCCMCACRLTSGISRLQDLARPRKHTVPSLELHHRQRRWHWGVWCGVRGSNKHHQQRHLNNERGGPLSRSARGIVSNNCHVLGWCVAVKVYQLR